jgi:hypothetical protein
MFLHTPKRELEKRGGDEVIITKSGMLHNLILTLLSA